MKIAIRPIAFRTLCMIALTLPFAGIQAHAQSGCVDQNGICVPVPVPAPEIDPSLASGGLALIAGAVLLVRGRRRKQ
jgi:ABC-type amino acid transport substrate-binding protein